MDANKIVGEVLVSARYLPSNKLVEARIVFEDRADSIYYGWQFKDSRGQLTAGRWLNVSKRIINIDPFDFVIEHARIGIEKYRINRKKQFEVVSIKTL